MIFNNMDDGLARQILSFSMMNRIIDQHLIQYSPVGIYPTLNRSHYMHISTVNSITKLPGNTEIIHWNHPADNGIVHIVNNLLIPETDVRCY